MSTAHRVVAGILTGFGALMLGAVPAYAAVTPNPAAGVMAAPSVTVNGTGTASGTPDELLVSLDVQTGADSVSAALDAANQEMKLVQDALGANGVARSDMQTSGMSVQPSYGQQGNITGYQVGESLSAVLHNLPQAGETMTAAIAAGGNAVRIDTVSLDISDKSALLAKARASAMADAKLRASQYATEAGRKLGPVITISEVNDTSPPIPLPGAMLGTANARSAVPIAAGTQKVTASVTVTYALS